MAHVVHGFVTFVAMIIVPKTAVRWSMMPRLRLKSGVSDLFNQPGYPARLIRLDCHKKCRLVSEADRIWQGPQIFPLLPSDNQKPRACPKITCLVLLSVLSRKVLYLKMCALLCLWTTVNRKVSRVKIKSVGRLSKFPDHGNLHWKCSAVSAAVLVEWNTWFEHSTICGGTSIRDTPGFNWVVRYGRNGRNWSDVNGNVLVLELLWTSMGRHK